MPYDHFNVEVDPFPYSDGSFDLVLCCEILEHLPSDPVRMLAEIHRVLRPGGALLLTTPNAVRAENVERIVRGDNVYEHLSGYGAYGRHNREYTLEELAALLGALGFVVEHASTRDTYYQPSRRLPVPLGAVRADRGDTLFVRARAEGPTRWRYPAWLFQSRQALERIVRPDVVAGVNDDLQARGLHPVDELVDGPAAWTGAAPVATILLETPGGPAELRIEGSAAPPAAGGPIRLEATLVGDGTGAFVGAWEIRSDGRTFSVTAPLTVPAGAVRVSLRTDRTWSPAAAGLSTDGRQLGVAIRRMSIGSDG
jgi:hypothetical protein